MIKLKLERLYALQVFDSRSEPTLKVFAEANGEKASAIVPKGASTGKKEAFELIDKKADFDGLGVEKAVSFINDNIFNLLKDVDIFKQSEIDNAMLKLDKTKYKTSIGGNTMLGVSLAISRLASKIKNIELYKYLGGINAFTLPMPMFNVLNGGKHASNGLDIQEIMLVPVGAKTFKEAYEFGVKVYRQLKKILLQKNISTSLGDEGGFVVPFKRTSEALKIIKKATENANLVFGKDIYISLDVAANSFYEKGKYLFEGKSLNSLEMIDFYMQLCKKYPILSIEDGLAEEDNNWNELCKKLGKNVLIVGDDLFATNKELLAKGIKNQLANAMIIKLNQIGTLSETLETIHLANKANVFTIVSHRSGDSEDDYIADLAVGVNSLFIKSGAPARSERTSKYNRLLEIENKLNSSSEFAGSFIRKYLV